MPAARVDDNRLYRALDHRSRSGQPTANVRGRLHVAKIWLRGVVEVIRLERLLQVAVQRVDVLIFRAERQTLQHDEQMQAGRLGSPLAAIGPGWFRAASSRLRADRPGQHGSRRRAHRRECSGCRACPPACNAFSQTLTKLLRLFADDLQTRWSCADSSRGATAGASSMFVIIRLRVFQPLAKVDQPVG